MPCPLQAMFEILTSEFSYQHSLGILVTEFLQSQPLRDAITQTDFHHLFSNILDVQRASQRWAGQARAGMLGCWVLGVLGHQGLGWVSGALGYSVVKGLGF